jgi:transposase
MALKKLHLNHPEAAAAADLLYPKEPIGWRRNRLLAVKLAARGEHTAAEIADICGIARGHLFGWIKKVREGGIESLLARDKPGPREGTRRGVDDAVIAELETKLKAGEFTTAVDALRWLKEVHSIDRSYQTVWRWLKKAGGVLLVPRPSHSKKDPAAAPEFREKLADKLIDLKIAEGSKVKLWVMDEARFGLHTQIRRLWACKGMRPVVSQQIRYEWDYLYGSLDIVGGQAHFCQIPSVNQSWDRAYLEDLAATDKEAIHVVIRDQAGFHLRDKDPRLPERVRIIDLPPYNPELNPCEQMWDMIKDRIGNRIFASVEELREAMLPALKHFWNDAESVLSLIGRGWMRDQANVLHPKQKSY